MERREGRVRYFGYGVVTGLIIASILLFLMRTYF